VREQKFTIVYLSSPDLFQQHPLNSSGRTDLPASSSLPVNPGRQMSKSGFQSKNCDIQLITSDVLWQRLNRFWLSTIGFWLQMATLESCDDAS
jgi:hypothetical protein